jgi:hypothetical protein
VAGGGFGVGNREDYGALDGERERIVERMVAVVREGGAGGEAGKGDGEVGGQEWDVIEGKDAVVECPDEELVFGMGEGVERSDGRIDERAENAGEGGFSAGGRAGEDEDGVGTGRAEGGEEPHGYPVEGGDGGVGKERGEGVGSQRPTICGWLCKAETQVE